MKIKLDKMEEVKPTEEQIVGGSYDDKLYASKFKNGKFFNIQSSATKTYNFEVSPKVRLSIVYIEKKNDVSSVIISRWKEKQGKYEKDGEVRLSNFDLAKIRDFLKLLEKLDLGAINKRRLNISEDTLRLDEGSKKKLRTLLSMPDGLKMVEEIIKSGAITSIDIINVGYRKSQLEIFKKMLTDSHEIENYKKSEGIFDQREEIVWAHFFNKNQWIFGYGLRYQFLNLITDQPHFGGENIKGQGEQIGDSLMATSGNLKFTVLVELKKPGSQLLMQQQRSGAYAVGRDLIDGISQLQVNCQTWETEGSRQNHNIEHSLKKGYYTHEPRGILIIGNTNQLDNFNKRNTFDIFRTNLSNPEIITFDELFERAKFIIENVSNEN